jgi:hypothetical protein
MQAHLRYWVISRLSGAFKILPHSSMTVLGCREIQYSDSKFTNIAGAGKKFM